MLDGSGSFGGPGQVLQYVFTGKQEPFPCVFE
jgi:hypothetical protein